MLRGIGEVNGLMNRGFSGVYWDNKGKKLWEYNGNIMGIESLCRCKTKKGHLKTRFSGILMGKERNIEHIYIYIYYVYIIYIYVQSNCKSRFGRLILWDISMGFDQVIG